MRDGRVTGWVEYFLYQATVNSVPMKEIINFFYFQLKKIFSIYNTGIKEMTKSLEPKIK